MDGLVVLAGASVFLTGFLSVRLHASRDRAINRVEASYGRLEEPALRGEAVDQEEIMAALVRGARAAGEATKLDPVSWATAMVNLLVFALALALADGILSNLKTSDGLLDSIGQVLDASTTELEVLSVVVAQALVVLLGFVDTAWVSRSLRTLRQDSPMVALDDTVRAINDGNVNVALDRSVQAVDAAPGLGVAWLWHGEAQAEAGDDRLAVDCYRRAIACGLGGPVSFWRRGLAFGRLARQELDDNLWNAAIEDFTQALALGPGRPMCENLLALRSHARRMAGDKEGAIRDTEEADRLLRTMTSDEQTEAQRLARQVPGRRVGPQD